jgi:hypothetical protein
VNKISILLSLSVLAIIIGLYAHINLDLSNFGHFLAGGVVMWGNAGIAAWARKK